MGMKRSCGNRLHVRACWSIVLFAVLIPWLLSGCGGPSGPATYDLSGNVTLDGKPVPGGQIVFEPDRTAGNSGSQGFAEIRDGKYDTTTGRGTVGGAHIVRISGHEGGPAGGASEAGSETEGSVTALFSDFQTKADLPKEPSTMDFEVTAADVESQQQAGSRGRKGP